MRQMFDKIAVKFMCITHTHIFTVQVNNMLGLPVCLTQMPTLGVVTFLQCWGMPHLSCLAIYWFPHTLSPVGREGITASFSGCYVEVDHYSS